MPYIPHLNAVVSFFLPSIALATSYNDIRTENRNSSPPFFLHPKRKDESNFLPFHVQQVCRPFPLFPYYEATVLSRYFSCANILSWGSPSPFSFLGDGALFWPPRVMLEISLSLLFFRMVWVVWSTRIIRGDVERKRVLDPFLFLGRKVRNFIPCIWCWWVKCIFPLSCFWGCQCFFFFSHRPYLRLRMNCFFPPLLVEM